VQIQRVILGLIIVPVITAIGLLVGCSNRAEIDRLATDNQPTPSQSEPQGGLQLTIRLKPTPEHPNIGQSDLDSVRKTLESRIYGLGISSASVQSNGNDRILVRLPSVKDPQQAERVLGGTAQLEFREQKTGTEGQLSTEMTVLKAVQTKRDILKKSKSPDKKAIATNRAAIEKQYTEIGKLFNKAAISGGHLKNANPEPVPDNPWQIALEFDAAGSDAFAKLTKKLAGTGRSIGVFLDNDPIFTPTVNAQYAATGITGGRAVIAGNFTAETARELAIQLRSGALPVPIEIIENRTVPSK
jgi:preprotein translocase subunit SecD